MPSQRKSFQDAAGKAGFVLSVAFLAFLYGYAVRGFDWYPNHLLERAWRQGEPILRSVIRLAPPFLTARVYQRSGVRIHEPNEVYEGVTLISSNWQDFDWRPGLKLVDQTGETLHEWDIDPTDIFPESFLAAPDLMQFNALDGSHLYKNGHVLINISRIGTALLDACGEPVWQLAVNSHHSLFVAEDRSIWVSSTRPNRGPHPLWKNRSRSVDHDRILHISHDGKILNEISVLDVLQANRGLIRHVMKNQSRHDVTHLNDVEPLASSMAREYPLFEAGDLLVSLKHLNLVLVFDPESLRVKWYASEPFLQQHDPDFIGQGWIAIFDNNEDGTHRGTRFGGSRIVALEPHTDSTRILFPTPQSDPFYTPNLGTWQLLKNGNLLLTEARAGRLVEVSPAGRTVWEWSQDPYSPSKVPRVASGARYDFSRDTVLSWPCSPATDNY